MNNWDSFINSNIKNIWNYKTVSIIWKRYLSNDGTIRDISTLDQKEPSTNGKEIATQNSSDFQK